MTHLRILILFLTIAFVGGIGWLVILLAKGYRFDIKNLTLRPRGLFVVTSEPDGAQIFINNELESATNATISLPPAIYEVELRKERYLTWKKTITIKKEEVTKIDAYLFPAAPSLSALTFSGATSPILSPDSTKIAYGVPSSEKSNGEKAGIWIMDLVDLPIGFSREPRKITDIDTKDTSWRWSPDTRQLLLATQKGFFLLDTNTLTPQTSLTALTDAKLSETIKKWQQEEEKKALANFQTLPQKLQEILKAKSIAFSPDGTKIIYTTTEDFQIPEKLISPLPGSSTQKEERSIKTGNTYVYDIKEDRNFLVYGKELVTDQEIFEEASKSARLATTKIDKPAKTKSSKPTPTPQPQLRAILRWLPTSNHVMLAELNKITITDYDGQNAQTVYAGPYDAPYAIPFPNPSRLLILTNLGAGPETISNLYSVSLR